MLPAISVKGYCSCHSMSHCSPEETQDGEKQDTGPRPLRCMGKEWFQWAQPLATSWLEKKTKFIHLRYLGFFKKLMVIFWCSDHLILVAKTVYSGSSLIFFRAVPQSYLRDCLLGQSPQKVHGIKHNSQFLGCAFFTWQNLEKERER